MDSPSISFQCIAVYQISHHVSMYRGPLYSFTRSFEAECSVSRGNAAWQRQPGCLL